MAHERLSIVDVESGGQPLRDAESKVWLAVNGEIYNHQKLRTQLSAAHPEVKYLTHSDCEVILHQYKYEKPEKFLPELNGMFAFCLVDERKPGTWMIARDHIGIIPLYMGRDAKGNLWVASELKALFDICVFFEDFPPGHYLTNDTPKPVPWYQPPWNDAKWFPSTPINLEELRTRLFESVRGQLMSDVPYGVLLSGGLDSSIISAIASKLCNTRIESEGKEPAWYPRLHSFSIGLEGSPDLAAAKVVADHLGTVHHAFQFTPQEGLDAYRNVIYHLETYDVTTVRASTPMFLMARKIRALGVKMVLSGEGADEVFGGYLYFHKCPNAKEFYEETVRKIQELYKFDCLRANKSMSAWGVEPRVPFLDKEFLEYAMNIDPADKMCGHKGKNGKIEKWILRKAFEDLLPPSVCWRQKEQFSDGVGYSWIDSIQANAEKMVSDTDLAAARFRFPINPPKTKEAFFIRETFENHFNHNSAAACVPGGPSVACSSSKAVEWDASFKLFADCSGRSVVGVHEDSYDEARRAQRSSVSADGLGSNKRKAETEPEAASPATKKSK